MKTQKRHRQKSSKITKRSIAFDDDDNMMVNGLSDDMDNLLESKFRIGAQEFEQGHHVHQNRRPYSLNKRTQDLSKVNQHMHNNQPQVDPINENDIIDENIDNQETESEYEDDDVDNKQNIEQIW